MTEAKFKRGSVSNLASLAKEDGSVIFAVKDASSPTTLVFDKAINGTVQRLGVAVDKAKSADSASVASTANVAKLISPFENATANASRNVWFSDSEKRNKPVYNDNFKYNPVSQILTTNISGSAAKWATARTVTLNGDLSGSFSIDGSGNVSANIYDYYSTVYVGNTNNYPYHRIAKLDTISSSYVDKSTLLYLSQGYQGGRFGIIRVTLRTNNVSGGAKSGVEARWLIRSGFNIDDIKIGHYSVAGKTYADVFYRSNSAYAGCVIRDLGSGSRGNIGRCWTLVNSRETENTTTSDKKTSFECWATIELAGKDLHNQAYSEIISSSDGGTVAYANNSGALGGSSLSQILASAGGGNAFTAIDTATNNIVKLTRANGSTVQKIIDNVSHASTSSYSSNSGQLQGHVITTASSGSSATFSNHIPYIGGSVLEIARYIDFHGDGTSRDYSTRLDAGTPSKLIVSGPSASTVTASYFEGNAKNANALGGSSLQQILDEIDSTSGSGNAFTGLDTTTNNVIKLTRANGGTVQKTINNVANATSATIATSANRINPTLSLTGGDGNTSGYRLIATISIAAWGNYRGVFVVKSRHTGGGILTVSVGCNTSPVSQSDGYFEIKYWGPTSSGSIISSDSWQGYISSDGTKGYLFWKYNDYNTCYVTQLSSDFSLSNGTWMTSIATSYGVRKSLTSINYASDSNALGGSSLQNILDKINTTSGSGNAFTGLDTTTNNVVKLTRANGGTVQKTINNVAHATSADNANLLDNLDSSKFVYGNNAVAVNTNYANASSIWKSGFYDLNVTGGASNDLPTTNSWHWLIQAGHRSNSSTYRYGLQITAPNDTNGNLYFRTNPSSGAGTWKTILDSHNYTSYAANKNAYNSASISNATIKLGRSDGSTGTTLTVNNVSHATSATIATSAVSVQTFPSTLTLGNGGPAIIDQDSATYRQRIRIEDNSTSGDNVFVFQQSSDSGVSYKDLFRILDNGSVVASTFAGYLNGNAKNSNALGGSSLSQILNSITSGSVQVDVATRLASSTKSIANNFTIRTGTPTSSWTQYPIFPIYNTTDTDLTAYKGKSLSILHMDGGAQRHDIVALNGANDGLIYATATSAGTTSSRIERILDGGNYGSLITNLNKQVTFANGLKAQKNVQMDGGNFSTGSTATTGNGETSISNVKISVSGNTLVITTK